jgi:Chromate transporter
MLDVWSVDRTHVSPIAKKTKPNSGSPIYMCVHTFTDTFYVVITTFWSLGLIAFGGPQAHVAILREHLVIRRNWINEEEFMELFAIGQVRACVRTWRWW